MKLKNKKIPLGDCLYAVFLCVLIIFKSKLFYSGLRLSTFPLPLSLATGGLLLLFFLISSALYPKHARTVLNVIYTLASVFMAVDAVYYAYVHKLPSVALLGMIWMIDGVSATVSDLITISHVLLIADLPFLLLYHINRDLIEVKLMRSRIAGVYGKFREAALSRTKAFAVGLPLCAVVAGYVALYPDFEPEYMLNELFCYHTVDIADTLSTHGREREVDKSQYTEPDWSDSEFYGLAEGRNVFIIQVEAMQNFVIGEDYEGQVLTPNLNALIENDSFYFDNYYYQIGGGNTSDAEFTVNNSLFAPSNDAAYVKYPTNTYYGLPHLLKDNGYSGAHVFHGYIPEYWNRQAAYPAQGFDSFTSLNDMEQTDMFEMGLSDMEMFRQSMEEIKTYEEPFYAFYITLSSHYPYAIPPKDREIELKEENVGKLFGLYLQSINYTDRAIGYFIELLKEAGLYENSIIVIYGDHYALTNTVHEIADPVSELLDRPYSLYDVFSVPLIIHIPGMEQTKTISTAGGHIDVLPTLLPLLGIHNDKAVMFGQNLLEAESGIVCQQTHMAIGSFISDEVFFQKPNNNIKANYDAYAYDTYEQLDPDLFKEDSEWCEERIADCAALLERNDVMLDQASQGKK